MIFIVPFGSPEIFGESQFLWPSSDLTARTCDCEAVASSLKTLAVPVRSFRMNAMRVTCTWNLLLYVVGSAARKAAATNPLCGSVR